SLPSASGGRVRAGSRAGDVVPAATPPLLATVTARGRDRAEAVLRLRRALDRTTVVVEKGATDSDFLRSVLDRPELVGGDVDDTWLDTLIEKGGLMPSPDPVALVAAAIEAYDSDQAFAESTFHARAARGRPERPEAVGTAVHLGYRGTQHLLRVDQVGPDTYRVHVNPSGAPVRVDVGVERVSTFERRITCNGRRHQVIAVTGGPDHRLEIDGRTHLVTREDGHVVRAGWPAFVVSLLAGVGEQVAVGQPVAVLEAMKMESVVTSPVAGEVTATEVVPNAQVDAGAPLLRVRASGESSGSTAGAGVLDLSGLTEPAGPATPAIPAGPECERVYAALDAYLLGYDLDPSSRKELLARQKALGNEGDVADPRLLTCEDAFLDLYADLASLYRPVSETVDGDIPVHGTQEYLHAYLQWLDPDRAGLPDGYRERLARALARYHVTGFRRTPALESAAVRLFRSVDRVRELADAVTVVLRRRLGDHAPLDGALAPDTRARLDRLAAAAQGRQQAVADLARDVRFHHLDRPIVRASAESVLLSMESHLAALGADRTRSERELRLQELVDCPQPLRGTLLHAWLASADPGLRDTVLEVYARRFYRFRDLHDLVLTHLRGLRIVTADYEVGDLPVRLVVAFTPFADVRATAVALAPHLATVGEDREIVVDLVCWRDGVRPPVEETVAALTSALAGGPFGRRVHRLDVTVTNHGGDVEEHFRTQHVTLRQPSDSAPDAGFVEDTAYRNLHPMLAKRLELWRLETFRLERRASPENVYLFLGVAHDNPSDRRLFALAEVPDLTRVEDAGPGQVSYPALERTGLQALAALRGCLAGFPDREKPAANRVVLSVRAPWTVPRESWTALARAFAPLAAGAGLEKVVLRVRIPEPEGSPEGSPENLRDAVLHIEGLGRRGVTVVEEPPGDVPLRPLDEYRRKVLLARRFGAPYPYEITRMLAPEPGTSGRFPAGTFTEYDLDADGALVPVGREPGGNDAHVVVGLLTNVTAKVPEGMTRVAILGDPTKGLGNLAEPECVRINAALDLAERLHVPVEWFAVSSGALISMDSGTENMDWISATLRRIIEFTQAGGEINIIVTGINVGGQPYWNAEATMLMHTKGILVMTPSSAMVLTGKQALDFSGGVSAEDNFGIGGYDRVMGPNGQGQYWAPSFEAACELLLAHYDHTYVVPGERFPRRRTTTDPTDRDVRHAPHADVPGCDFTRVGDIFEANPDRKKPFDMRSVMRAVADADAEPLERWKNWRGGDTSIVWDAHIGGIPVCLLGLESRTVPRRGFVPADGPPQWTSGTLFPQASRKTARAINAASGNRPLVVLANLSGFDGSPESLRRWQLEYGAEIGRAVTNFRGPIVFVVVSRYHGGAFVVFSKALNPSLEIAAVRGSFASVIGGAPAAATVFAREVRIRTEKDPRVAALRAEAATATGRLAADVRARLHETTGAVRSEKLGEVAGEFDAVHTIDRALRVGSVDRIIEAATIRPYVIEALERKLALPS
ncbi:MAG: hypothetical protein QG622_3168, partial [Actinomycetota bacterium]|nr:hypothetical protein [Actinomycetota bacterium]